MKAIWAVVLVKDFERAKQRLAWSLGPEERQELARANAKLALRAAAAADHVLAVCGSPEAAELATAAGADALLETKPEGQSPAARLGLERATSAGAAAALLLSSDLPLITRGAVTRMLRTAWRIPAPVVVAAPAIGRGGTNALYMAPPAVVGLHFGDDSLAKFERDARAGGVSFRLHLSRALALDLDEPSDLKLLERAR